MKKNQAASQTNVWDDNPAGQSDPSADEIIAVAEQVAGVAPQKPPGSIQADYDLEGLMTDFPTAKELERFVFDETGIVLNLKGRANKLKYQVAMDVLNGIEVDLKFIGGENPYVEKSEMVPVDPIKDPPSRDLTLPDRSQVQNLFVSNQIPHPDHEARAMDKKVSVIFRKYNNNAISYEVLGPLDQRPYGEKIDKYGRIRPEVIKWIDPRTGEQIIMREDGTLTPQGRKLRALMQTFKVNNSNYWATWIDREFITVNDAVINNPWNDE